MSTASDTDIIERIRHGDEFALRELLKIYGVKLLRVAVPITGSEDVAQDVVQDVFIKIWDMRTQLRIHGSVAAYLYRAVRNRALDVRKHERAQHALESHIQIEDDEGDGIDRDDLSAAVEEALESLPPRAREIFL